MTTTEVVTFAQAADRLGVSRQTIYSWVASGKLIVHKVAGRRFILLTVNGDTDKPKPKS